MVWVVVVCVEYYCMLILLVENVFVFEKWVLFLVWKDVLCCLGYFVFLYLVDVVDYGVLQNCECLFIVCICLCWLLKLCLLCWLYVFIVDVFEWDVYFWMLINIVRCSFNMICCIEVGCVVFGYCFFVLYYFSGSGCIGCSIECLIGMILICDCWVVI